MRDMLVGHFGPMGDWIPEGACPCDRCVAERSLFDPVVKLATALHSAACEGINCPQYMHRCIAYGEPAADCPLGWGKAAARVEGALCARCGHPKSTHTIPDTGSCRVGSSNWLQASKEGLMEDRLLRNAEIGDLLDCEKEKEYACSLGSVHTVDVDALLVAQASHTEQRERQELVEWADGWCAGHEWDNLPHARRGCLRCWDELVKAASQGLAPTESGQWPESEVG